MKELVEKLSSLLHTEPEKIPDIILKLRREIEEMEEEIAELNK